jgi:site-specific DNA recombinase
MTDAAPAPPDVTPGAALAKAALYLRVSTGRQAESDLSIPDQRRQIRAYCLAKCWDVAVEFVEPGNTATDDRRSAFQAMIDAALVKPPTFTVIVVTPSRASFAINSSLSSTFATWPRTVCG